MTGDVSKLPTNLRKALNAELQSGEHILYAAQPDWRAEWGKLLVIAVFGIGWMSISGPMAILVWSNALGIELPNVTGGMGPNMSLFFSVFMIPFVVIGLMALAAPFLSIRKSRNTAHAVTDARLINVYTGADTSVESYPFAKINFIKRRDRRDGFGTLEIGYGLEKDSDGDPRPLTTDWPGIPNARSAEAAIREHAKWVR